MVRENAATERWFFYQDVSGLWKWARLDLLGTILAHSGSGFDSREDCVDHARSSGYDGESQRALGLALGQPPSGAGSRLQF